MECRKSKYASEQAAELDIARIKRLSKRERLPQRAYLCPQCSSWHITSQRHKASEENDLLKKKLAEAKAKIKELNIKVAELSRKKGMNWELNVLRKNNEMLAAENKQLLAKLQKHTHNSKQIEKFNNRYLGRKF